MKKAVIKTGAKQYLVSEGDVISVELLPDTKQVDFEPLLLIDGEAIKIGTPLVKGAKISAQILEAETKAKKVTAIRYKAKKRVKKIHGHRQRLTQVKIKTISDK